MSAIDFCCKHDAVGSTHICIIEGEVLDSEIMQKMPTSQVGKDFICCTKIVIRIENEMGDFDI